MGSQAFRSVVRAAVAAAVCPHMPPPPPLSAAALARAKRFARSPRTPRTPMLGTPRVSLFSGAARANQWRGCVVSTHTFFETLRQKTQCNAKSFLAKWPVQPFFPRPILPNFSVLARACLWCVGAPIWVLTSPRA